LPFLLRAFREYKHRYHSDHQLVCIGATGWMADAERDFIESLSSASDIHFLGRLSDPDTFALIQQATAYISTARCEGFGLGLSEAMALGCPPIAARNTSQVEVVDGIGILFSSLEELINALHSAAVTGCVREDIQQQAFDRFLWARSAAQINTLLEKQATYL
jgi:glycosyltransferase involved in cell wall biosynthesis